VLLTIPGLLVFPHWLLRSANKSVRGVCTLLAVHHFGIVAFSIFDFQGSGDTMILLHSFAFFGGIALIDLFNLIERAPLRPETSRRLGIAMAVALLLVVRPGFSEYAGLKTRIAPIRTKLTDQITMARKIERIARGKTIMVLGPTEMAMLGDLKPLSNFFFWNEAAEYEYRRTRGEGPKGAFLALLLEYNPDVIVSNRGRKMPASSPYVYTDLGKPGGYQIEVFVRAPER
jgi:hypothetical protein